MRTTVIITNRYISTQMCIHSHNFTDMADVLVFPNGEIEHNPGGKIKIPCGYSFDRIKGRRLLLKYDPNTTLGKAEALLDRCEPSNVLTLIKISYTAKDDEIRNAALILLSNYKYMELLCPSYDDLQCIPSGLSELLLMNPDSLEGLGTSCHNLKKLRVSDYTICESRYIPRVSTLGIYGDDKLTNIKCVPDSVMELELSHCPKLIDLSGFTGNLEKIFISECYNFSLIGCPQSVRTVEFENCDNIRDFHAVPPGAVLSFN